MTISRSLATAFFVVLSGCTGMPPAADKAVLFNKAVEDSSNQLLLLNVLRASQRMPVYYTRLSNLQSVGALKSSVTSTFQLGPRSADTLGLSIPFGADQTDTVGVQVLDDQKFIQGILDRAKPETLAFYLAQGWPEDLLFHLFIERIEIEQGYFDKAIKPSIPNACDGANVRHFRDEQRNKHQNIVVDNNPFDGLKCFQSVLRLLEGSFSLGLVEGKSFKPAGITVQSESAAFATPVVEALKAGFVLKRFAVPRPMPNDPKHTECALAVGKLISATTFQVDPPATENGELDTTALFSITENFVRSLPNKDGAVRLTIAGAGTSASDGCTEKAQVAPPMAFYLRSPDSMIYYLGEIVRASRVVENGTTVAPVKVKSSKGPIDLFRVLRGDDSAAVSVDFQGATYSIPPTYPADDHRSTQVMTLLNQLITLQKEAGSAPSLPPVTVINAN
ncbi:MAG: hypothetical protein HOP13_10935 [Alphaproteobacteria bacterium]|nr:hypothetical protein [Alphaproteobacteria bacterium]